MAELAKDQTTQVAQMFHDLGMMTNHTPPGKYQIGNTTPQTLNLGTLKNTLKKHFLVGVVPRPENTQVDTVGDTLGQSQENTPVGGPLFCNVRGF